MSNLKVGIIAIVSWLVVTVIAFSVMPDAFASLIAVFGLFSIPVVIFFNEKIREFFAARAAQAKRQGPAKQKPSTGSANNDHDDAGDDDEQGEIEVDLSVDNLKRVFGAENVCDAVSYERLAADRLITADTKFGGTPDFVKNEHWPRCKRCGLPMTFIGQIAVGPTTPVRYPVEGRLFIFLCNSDPTAGEECQTWDHASGAAACFVQPGLDAPLPLGEGENELEALRVAVKRNQKNWRGGSTLFTGLKRKPGEKEYLPYLSRQYETEAKAVQSVRLPENSAKIQYEHFSAVAKNIDVQAGGLADWIQEEVTIPCSCGAPTELVLQFEAFDEVINLGDSGRAYVFACRDRHAPDAFYLEWQCT